MISRALLVAVGLAFAPAVWAGTPVPVTELPGAVTKAVENYFPGAKATSAQRDKDDGKEHFEVRIEYKDLHLEVDISPEGKVLDVDQKR